MSSTMYKRGFKLVAEGLCVGFLHVTPCLDGVCQSPRFARKSANSICSCSSLQSRKDSCTIMSMAQWSDQLLEPGMQSSRSLRSRRDMIVFLLPPWLQSKPADACLTFGTQMHACKLVNQESLLVVSMLARSKGGCRFVYARSKGHLAP